MQTTADEITVPDDVADEPAWEWVNGRALQKLSPQTPHAILQGALARALDAWGGERGETGTEWRFRITPKGEPTRPLVPDVAFVPFDRLLTADDWLSPTVPPEVVVEVLSPGERRRDIDEKIRVYLAAGVGLVLYVDPRQRSIEAYESDGTRVAGALASYTSAVFPDLTCDLATLFARLDRFPRMR